PARARERGLEPMHDFRIEKGLHLVSNLVDIGRIADACRGYDVLHVHSSHDHLLGAMGARRSKHARVVRTNERAIAVKKNPASSFLFRKLTDGYVTYSKSALEAD